MSYGASLSENYHGSCSLKDHSAPFSQIPRNCFGIDSLQCSKSIDAHKSCFELP